MTAPDTDLWQKLREAAERALGPVGFKAVGRDSFPNAQSPAHPHTLFLAPYAIAHLAWVTTVEVESAAQIGRAAVEDISGLLQLRSKADQRLDGYVVLALGLAPQSDELCSFVRTFEGERLVCRRHVVWPDQTGPDDNVAWSQRFDRVTIAVLPETARTAAPSTAPIPPSALIQLIDTKMAEGIHWGPLAEQLDQLARNRAESPPQ